MCALLRVLRKRLAKICPVSGRRAYILQTCGNGTHTTNQKIYRRMATLKDLCSSVPKSLLRVQTDYNLNLQKQAAYNKRMQQLDMEHAIFEQCKHTRTQKRVKNKFSTEQAGRCSQSTSTRRFATRQTFVEKRGTSVRTYTLTSYTNVVCKSYSNKY